MNTNLNREGKNTYALLSLLDWVAPAVIYSRYTHYNRYMSEFPGMNKSFVFNSTEYDHLGVRDLTVNLQYSLLTYEPNKTDSFKRVFS